MLTMANHGMVGEKFSIQTIIFWKIENNCDPHVLAVKWSGHHAGCVY
jgi:hypothetical protein